MPLSVPIMSRHSDIMLGRLRGQTNMATGLMIDDVSEFGEGLCEITPTQIARQSHAAINSSRT